MNKKGFVYDWLGMFIIFGVYALIFLVFLIVFGITGVGSAEYSVEGKVAGSSVPNHVLMGYLNSDVSMEYGRISMVQLIDLAERDPDKWKRLLEVKTYGFIRGLDYDFGIYDKDPKEIHFLEIDKGYIAVERALIFDIAPFLSFIISSLVIFDKSSSLEIAKNGKNNNNISILKFIIYFF